ncbi:hypothetical protein E4U41_006630, partial [Claviceps citrina]
MAMHEKQPAPDNEAVGTRFFIDPPGSSTHDKTTVDVVAVPCPGGHPFRSWSRDGLMSRYYGALSMRDAGVREDADRDRPSPAWVRQGIRREADCARILLYEHPGLEDETTTLSGLADALLQDLQRLRDAEGRERPVIFVAHSLGGLVVKMALTRAGRDGRYGNILRECYGVAFFGTPHQGSSYFAMPSLANSIQNLLQLSSPLPQSITKDLRVGNSLLVRADEDFRAVSHDMQVWTFYETIDSRLSAGGGSDSRDVCFTAPLTSIKSAVLGIRQERIFPLQSDHANMASFGRHNVHTLRMFLKQLAYQIGQADGNARSDEMGGGGGRWDLRLAHKVSVEVHGFFDEPPASQGRQQGVKEEEEEEEEVVVAPSIVRAWSTRVPLREFLDKGPDACLSERLKEVSGSPAQERFLRRRGRTSLVGGNAERPGGAPPPPPAAVPSPPPTAVRNALGIQDTFSCTGLVSLPVTLPLRAASPVSSSTALRALSPFIRADLEQDLAVDRLSPPLTGRMGRSVSRSFSLDSDGHRLEQQSRSAWAEAVLPDPGDVDATTPSFLPPPPLPPPPETVIVDGVSMAFAPPDVKSRKFVWMHVPFNNPTWVKSILQTLAVSYGKDYSALYGQDFWMTKHTRGRHAQHYAYHAKPGCYFSAAPTLSPRTRSVGNLSPSPPLRTTGDSMYTCLFLPYLHFDSYKRLIRRRHLVIQRLSQGRAQPVPEDVARSDSLELQVMWEYLGHDPPINCRRTLDQYAYPSLRDTRSRDDDQMLYKLTKERVRRPVEEKGPVLQRLGSSSRVTASDSHASSQPRQPSSRSAESGSLSSWRERILGREAHGADEEEEEEDKVLNGNVLMVDQLWLWVVESHTVLSLFPKRESDPIEGPLYQQADLRDSIFNEVNVDVTRQCENAWDLAALAALHAVSVLLDRSSHPDLEVFRIFEEAISLLTEKLTSSLKVFRTKGFRDKASDQEPLDDGVRSIRKRHKEEGCRAERENRDNTSALLELRDMEDELQTLLQLFERQSKVVMSMQSIYNRPELRDQTANGRGFLGEALKRLREYAQQTNEMVRRVRATRDDYDKLLQMVQRQAQVDEVRLSRLHADLASAQSRSVVIFTTFTVIFLPLTFFTGLFGMNTHEWAGADIYEIQEAQSKKILTKSQVIGSE